MAGNNARTRNRFGSSKEPDEIEWSVAVLGASGTGKTALVNQYLHKLFIERYTPTVEDFSWVEYEVNPQTGACVVVKIIDHSGSCEFTAMRDLYISTANGFLLVCAANEPKSVSEIDHLLTLIEEKNTKKPSIVVCINKIDLLGEPSNNNSLTDSDVGKDDKSSYHSLCDAVDQLCGAHKIQNHFFTTAREFGSIQPVFTCLFEDIANNEALDGPGLLNSEPTSEQEGGRRSSTTQSWVKRRQSMPHHTLQATLADFSGKNRRKYHSQYTKTNTRGSKPVKETKSSGMGDNEIDGEDRRHSVFGLPNIFRKRSSTPSERKPC